MGGLYTYRWGSSRPYVETKPGIVPNILSTTVLAVVCVGGGGIWETRDVKVDGVDEIGEARNGWEVVGDRVEGLLTWSTRAHTHPLPGHQIGL